MNDMRDSTLAFLRAMIFYTAMTAAGIALYLIAGPR